jgi:osmoprotectant transport system ATP-binding protein
MTGDPSTIEPSTSDRPMIALRNVTKRFPGQARAAVNELSLDIRGGETVMLVGPSGCGKTTTMRMINRLIEPTSGSIEVDGRDVLAQDPVELRRGIGYVIQSIGLLPHRTVAQNIATVPRLVGWDDARIAERVAELMGIFELEPEMKDRYPAELSGGQRQRVGVARALAVDPPVMLMDEPFAAVDPIVRARLQDQFMEIQRRLKKTIVFVTHDIDEAIKMADRIAILNVGGVVEQFAPPEEILRVPANEFVERFVGAERGLKRLALIRVAEIKTDEGPVVSPATTASEARAEMDRFALDWATVVQDGRMLGWIDRDALEGKASVGEVATRRFSAYLREDNSLREALDAIVSTRTNVAIVVGEGDVYRGILTLDRLSQEITQ